MQDRTRRIGGHRSSARPMRMHSASQACAARLGGERITFQSSLPSSIMERQPSTLTGVKEPMASEAAPISTTSTGSLSPNAPPTSASPFSPGSSHVYRRQP